MAGKGMDLLGLAYTGLEDSRSMLLNDVLRYTSAVLDIQEWINGRGRYKSPPKY